MKGMDEGRVYVHHIVLGKKCKKNYVPKFENGTRLYDRKNEIKKCRIYIWICIFLDNYMYIYKIASRRTLRENMSVYIIR